MGRGAIPGERGRLPRWAHDGSATSGEGKHGRSCYGRARTLAQATQPAGCGRHNQGCWLLAVDVDVDVSVSVSSADRIYAEQEYTTAQSGPELFIGPRPCGVSAGWQWQWEAGRKADRQTGTNTIHIHMHTHTHIHMHALAPTRHMHYPPWTGRQAGGGGPQIACPVHTSTFRPPTDRLPPAPSPMDAA